MSNKLSFLVLIQLVTLSLFSQGPSITSWLQNTSILGTYYLEGSSEAISNDVLVNCQSVDYSDDFVYVSTKGIPAYPTGPFLDRNPSLAEDQEAIFKFPLNPQQNNGTLKTTTGGNVAVFINGVALFDYRDGVAWNSTTNALCGGPGNDACPGARNSQVWNRDAVVAERGGFDCSKGHPAGGNYHHHQNPSSFNMDLNVLSTVCNLYAADGLYTMDSTKHSPLIGYAYDGFPIYGAYGYKGINGEGGIVRIKPSYLLANYAVRTHYPDGTDVNDGPEVNDTYPLGYFREDYLYTISTESDYLDEHNGRFCVTPEYPEGTYAYFATVDENWNSAYPYVIGPTFYGTYANRSVTSINEATENYVPVLTNISSTDLNESKISVFPNPTSDLMVIQVNGLLEVDLDLSLIDVNGVVVKKEVISKGQTLLYIDTQALYEGVYLVNLSNGSTSYSQKVEVKKE